MLLAVSPMQKDISRVDFPEDYPFPESVLGRGRDFRSASMLMLVSLSIHAKLGPVGSLQLKSACPQFQSAR